MTLAEKEARSARFRRTLAMLALAAAPAFAADIDRPNSFLVYAGRMSTTDFGATLLFNLAASKDEPRWDNNTFGFDYERVLLQFGHGFSVRGEIGVDDRYGHYEVCCLVVKDHVPHPDLTVYHPSDVHTVETWLGAKLRKDDVVLGGPFRIALGFAIGLSYVDESIGRERQREIDYRADAHFLGYLAPEMGLSMTTLPGWEAVIRMPHRSGLNGTFNHMKEGYNAMTAGVRYSY